MAKFGATYMSCYDGPEYSFGTLTLSAVTFDAGDPQGTAIGNIGGFANADDSDLSIVETNNYFQLDGVGLEVGSAGADLVAGTYNVTIRETNPWVAGQYQDKVFTITVAP